MYSLRWRVLALLAFVAIAAAGAIPADNIEGPVALSRAVPAAPKPDVPQNVTDAVAALREACAAWPPPPPVVVSSGLVPRSRVEVYPERGICDFVSDPDQTVIRYLIVGGVAGAILFFVTLVVFCLLRGVLIWAWNWRLSTGAKSW